MFDSKMIHNLQVKRMRRVSKVDDNGILTDICPATAVYITGLSISIAYIQF